ncbi:MAG: sporulation protein YpjB [Bacillus sp. (in: firmicutes)]
MFRKTVIVFILIASITLQSAFCVAASSEVEGINRLSDDALLLAKSNRYDKTLEILEDISRELVGLTANGRSLEMDELKVVTTAYDEAYAAMSSRSSSHEEKIKAMTKLRLTVDAAHSQHQPLWSYMEDQMIATFIHTKEAAMDQDTQAFHSNLNQLLAQYDLIHYSLKLELGEERFQALDARFAFLDQYRPEILHQESSQREIDSLRYEMEKIFDGQEEDEADPSLWWVIITTGSIIVMTLAYVGYRKFKGHKKEDEVRRKLND